MIAGLYPGDVQLNQVVLDLARDAAENVGYGPPLALRAPEAVEDGNAKDEWPRLA